ncbi:MAG: aspartyl/asparaginyl beta-hydroxylase domain-containing protein [Chitinophagaceae bacterium]|nr:MAG: aspartyl/asparaginyl beta-hydroxylase domain-containing protein [Chitinophagaceae bacterium]
MLQAGLWKDHYNRSNYEGSWSTLQLRSVDGSLNNNTAIHAGAENIFKDTPLMEKCAYIKQVVDFFKIEKTAVRLMKLNAGAVIKPHSDPGLNFEEGELRLHIPVITNDQLFFYLQEERLQMEEGTAWYMNLSLQHSVRNEGKTDRVHLVIDGIVNDWLKAYFNEPQHFKAEMEAPAAKDYSTADKRKIIEQLRQMNTETGNRLAVEMEADLQQINS